MKKRRSTHMIYTYTHINIYIILNFRLKESKKKNKLFIEKYIISTYLLLLLLLLLLLSMRTKSYTTCVSPTAYNTDTKRTHTQSIHAISYENVKLHVVVVTRPVVCIFTHCQSKPKGFLQLARRYTRPYKLAVQKTKNKHVTCSTFIRRFIRSSSL